MISGAADPFAEEGLFRQEEEEGIRFGADGVLVVRHLEVHLLDAVVECEEDLPL